MNWQHATASDLMQTNLVTVAANTPLREVERILAEHRISGVPVTDVAGHIAGIVSMRDIVEFRAEDDDVTNERRVGAAPDPDDPEGSTYVARDASEATAADVMTAEVYAVESNATVPEVAREMVRRQVHRVLVRHRGHYVGLISTFDLLARVAAD
jgi:CBS domain-containing protein